MSLLVRESIPAAEQLLSRQPVIGDVACLTTDQIVRHDVQLPPAVFTKNSGERGWRPANSDPELSSFLRSTVVLVNTPGSSGETLPLSVRQELELNRRYRRPCVYPTSGRSVSHRAACILFLVLLSHTCTTTSVVFPLTNDVKSGSLLRIIQRAWIKESKEFSNIQFIFRLYSNLFRRFFLRLCPFQWINACDVFKEN